MSEVSTAELTTAARIVGAMAHELNNPLQGIISLLAVENREPSANETLRKRLKLLNEGISRIAKTVESFSVMYENLPRTPELVSANDVIHHIETTFISDKFKVKFETQENILGTFRSFIPEQYKVILDMLNTAAEKEDVLLIKSIKTENSLQIMFELKSTNNEETDEWHTLNLSPELSGLPVLLQEITRMAGGETEYKFDKHRLRGFKLILPYA